jgi:ubiquinone/menaquinone biosynthesis C-methylase UbiE
MPSGSIAFDRAADFYDETRGFPPGEARPAVALIAQVGEFGPDSRVLEVGVGTGRVGVPLAAHAGAYVGVDLSRPMLDVLRAKPEGGAVRVAQADITELPLAAGRFDAVVAVHIFHLIPTWRQALREIARVLRPGGMLLHCYNDQVNDDRSQLLWDTWNAVVPRVQTGRVGVKRSEQATFLVDLGWRPCGDIHTYHYKITRRASGFTNMLKKRIWSSLWSVDDDMLAKGVEAVQAAIDAHFDDPDEPIVLDASFNVQALLPPA